MLHYYFSEMAPSSMHGGGLTLLKVLDEQLSSVRTFVHIGQFARDYPPVRSIAPRSIFFTRLTESPLFKKVIRARASALAAKLTYPLWIPTVRQKVRRIVEKDPDGYWLICPQSVRSLEIWNGGAAPLSDNYITWMMDDHVVRYRDGRLQYSQQNQELMRRHLQSAAAVLVISEEMGEFYRDKFDVQSTVIFGGYERKLTPQFNEEDSTTASKLDRDLQIGYFGAIGPWQLPVLRAFSAVVAETSDTLNIYSPHSACELSDLPNVRLHAAVPSDEVFRHMQRQNVLLLPISFAEDLRHMTDLNYATKMSEYMGSTRATLVVGPPHAAMTRFLQSRNAAALVTNLEPSNIKQSLNSLRSLDYRLSIARTAFALASTELSMATIRSRLNFTLAKLGIGS